MIEMLPPACPKELFLLEVQAVDQVLLKSGGVLVRCVGKWQGYSSA